MRKRVKAWIGLSGTRLKVCCASVEKRYLYWHTKVIRGTIEYDDGREPRRKGVICECMSGFTPTHSTDNCPSKRKPARKKARK